MFSKLTLGPFRNKTGGKLHVSNDGHFLGIDLRLNTISYPHNVGGTALQTDIGHARL